MTQAVEIPKIQTTEDYSQFRLMKGNRTVDYNHVKRLKREMESNPNLLATNPILVNEHMFIIDGQHRRQAAQELGLPVYYMMVTGTTIDATRHLNTTQRRWTMLDFAKSYADSGREDYVTFLRTVEQYPEIAPGIIRTYLAGGQKHGIENDFKRGEYQIGDLEQAKEFLARLETIRKKTHTKINAPMAHALLALFRGEVRGADDFDYKLFMQKLDRETAVELFKPVSSVRGCLRSVEDIYNFQSKVQKRLY